MQGRETDKDRYREKKERCIVFWLEKEHSPAVRLLTVIVLIL